MKIHGRRICTVRTRTVRANCRTMGDVGKSCRLCLSKDELQVSIFGEYSLKRRLPEKMESCLQLRVHPKDPYSEFLCYACVHKLDTFTEFKNRVKLTLRKAKDKRIIKDSKDNTLQIVRRRQTECSDYFRAKKLFKNTNDVSANRKMVDKENVVSHRLPKNALDIFECEDSDKVIKKDVSSHDDREDSFSLTPDIDYIFKLHQ